MCNYSILSTITRFVNSNVTSDELRVEKEELLESLEMYYRVFFLGEDVDKEKTEA